MSSDSVYKDRARDIYAELPGDSSIYDYLEPVPDGHTKAHPPEIGYAVIGMLTAGLSLHEIGAHKGMPSADLIAWWAAGEWTEGAAGAVSRHYAQARVAQGEMLASLAIRMVTELESGKRYDGSKLDADAFKRYRVALDSLRWMLPKMARGTWGDHLQIEHSGSITLEAIAREAEQRGNLLATAKGRSHGETIEGELVED